MAENEIQARKGSSGKPGKMVKPKALAFQKPRSLAEIQARQDAKGTRRRPTKAFVAVAAKAKPGPISVPDVEPASCEEPDEESKTSAQ